MKSHELYCMSLCQGSSLVSVLEVFCAFPQHNGNGKFCPILVLKSATILCVCVSEWMTIQALVVFGPPSHLFIPVFDAFLGFQRSNLVCRGPEGSIHPLVLALHISTFRAGLDILA